MQDPYNPLLRGVCTRSERLYEKFEDICAEIWAIHVKLSEKLALGKNEVVVQVIGTSMTCSGIGMTSTSTVPASIGTVPVEIGMTTTEIGTMSSTLR